MISADGGEAGSAFETREEATSPLPRFPAVRRDHLPPQGGLPRRPVCPGVPERLRAALRDYPLGPMHRHPGEYRDANALRPVSHAV